ncbi:pyridoxamine 5'-phosphate oxidase family protein [Nitriliruptor alkaliphilus]|uniref:pyridoxamine 5'-phosphate oxidase family protein n=1 Tax=Nitriliruptor alkaliphilus TaxID=427918 RepID=UPI000A9503CD|nr:pyridoxamine 5'-phosphate oxidase family protein [Nitriliruptor alkaliphilus]
MTADVPLDPDRFYTPEQRVLQDATDNRALADRLVGAIVTPQLPPEHAAFIASRDFFFLATVDAAGQPTVSYKGGAPGFVHVPDPSTVVFPDYDGNGMFLSLGNVQATARIGMLFLDLETPHRLRVQADASVHDDDPALERFPGANVIVRAQVTAVFVNCGRYIHPHRRVGSSRFVPDTLGAQPYPAWKRIDAFQDVLPAADRGRAADEGGTITPDEYHARVRAGEP